MDYSQILQIIKGIILKDAILKSSAGTAAFLLLIYVPILDRIALKNMDGIPKWRDNLYFGDQID